jgi:hypothetical protein
MVLRSRASLRRNSQTGKIVCARGHCSKTKRAQSPARSKLKKIYPRGKTLKKIPKELFSNKNCNAGCAARKPMVF